MVVSKTFIAPVDFLYTAVQHKSTDKPTTTLSLTVASHLSNGFDFRISAEGENFVFRPSLRLSSAQRTLHLLEVKYAIKWYKSTDWNRFKRLSQWFP